MDNHNYCKAVNIEGVQVKATFQSRVVVGGKYFFTVFYVFTPQKQEVYA